MKLLNWIDGSANYTINDKAKHFEDDYKPRKSYYDNASTSKKEKSIIKNSFLFYFN
ncbi:MAG: hypothetical protein VX114_04050 [Chloroflexota bacterium]|nr:hypothetical protein [Chloroflexota bacterium]